MEFYSYLSNSIDRYIYTIGLYYEVVICKEDGEVQGLWEPFHGPMKVGSFYRIVNKKSDSQYAAFVSSITYARYILPEEGLFLLKENAMLFEMWLAYLLREGDRSGEFGVSLEKAEKKNKNKQYYLVDLAEGKPRRAKTKIIRVHLKKRFSKIFIPKKFYCCFFKYIYVGFLNSKYFSYFSNRFIFLIMINVITMGKSI